MVRILDKPYEHMSKEEKKELFESKDHTLPSNVFKAHKRYYVQHKINGRKVVNKSFKDKDEAIQYRNKMVAAGIITDRTGRHRIKAYEDRYLQRTKSGHYAIHKKIGDSYHYFGTFRSLVDAREERDYLESIGWDYSNME